jgi:uncharacterized membrane protein HdeD (DUF308 family)
MVVWLEIETWVIGQDGVKKGWWWMGEMGLLDFVAPVCIWAYFHCCSGVCLYHGLQGAGDMYS